MKMDLSWHKECLNNAKNSLLRAEQSISEALERLAEDRSRIKFHEQQILSAEAKGMTGFDSTRFMKDSDPNRWR